MKDTELELRKKATLLEITISVNKPSIETRFQGLKNRFEEFERASIRQRIRCDFELKQRANDQMNLHGNVENSTKSDNSNLKILQL